MNATPEIPDSREESSERSKGASAGGRWLRRGGIFAAGLAGVLVGAMISVAALGLYATGAIGNGLFGSNATVTSAPTINASVKGGGSAIDAATIYKADAPGIVQVESEVTGGSSGPLGGLEQQGGTALGSGFMIDGQGRILTNFHVVDGASKTTVTLQNEKTYDAKIVGSDPSNDVAVLQINAPAGELHPLPLGDSSKLAVGKPVVAIGNPLGYSGSESTGIISGLGRDIPAPNGFTIPGAIQTDAPITNGNSGGPLIDSNGRVIGINSQVAANQNGTGQAEGIGFAVPINAAKDSVGQLDRTGEIKQPYLGIQGYGITPEMAGSFATNDGVAIARVSPGGPADSAGIKGGNKTVDAGGASFIVGGDVITAVDGTSVKDMGDLQKVISKDKVGQKVSLEILRGSQNTGGQVTLGERPTTAQG